MDSDAKLAALLGVTRGYISSVRSGRKGVSLKLSRVVFQRLGRDLDSESVHALFVPTKVRVFRKQHTALRVRVIERAGGHCELCRMAAPFTGPDGQPYLEMRHLVPLQKGGADSLENLVALCPNCHRRVALNPSKDDLKNLKILAKKYKGCAH